MEKTKTSEALVGTATKWWEEPNGGTKKKQVEMTGKSRKPVDGFLARVEVIGGWGE